MLRLRGGPAAARCGPGRLKAHNDWRGLGTAIGGAGAARQIDLLGSAETLGDRRQGSVRRQVRLYRASRSHIVPSPRLARTGAAPPISAGPGDVESREPSRSTTAERITVTVERVDDEASERYDDWRDACAAVDDAYCEWLSASPDDQPAAFAAYRMALDAEESFATVYRAVIDRVGQGPAVGAAPAWQEQSTDPRAAAVRVLVADADGFARRLLQRVLHEVDEIAVVTGACDGREAWELVRRQPPDVLMVDIGVPPAGGVELIRKVVGELPRVRIVTVSAGDEWDLAVLAALRAGAIGHIDKDTAPEQIARLALLAARGEAIVPRRLTGRLLANWRIQPPAAGDRGAAA